MSASVVARTADHTAWQWPLDFAGYDIQRPCLEDISFDALSRLRHATSSHKRLRSDVLRVSRALAGLGLIPRALNPWVRDRSSAPDRRPHSRRDAAVVSNIAIAPEWSVRRALAGHNDVIAESQECVRLATPDDWPMGIGHVRRFSGSRALVAREAVRAGAAAGQPWRFYDLGHGYCTSDFFDQCPHRMACAKCAFYRPKGSAAALFLEGKAGLRQPSRMVSPRLTRC
jgi:hypothetical protein